MFCSVAGWHVNVNRFLFLFYVALRYACVDVPVQYKCLYPVHVLWRQRPPVTFGIVPRYFKRSHLAWLEVYFALLCSALLHTYVVASHSDVCFYVMYLVTTKSCVYIGARNCGCIATSWDYLNLCIFFNIFFYQRYFIFGLPQHKENYCYLRKYFFSIIKIRTSYSRIFH